MRTWQTPIFTSLSGLATGAWLVWAHLLWPGLLVALLVAICATGYAYWRKFPNDAHGARLLVSIMMTVTVFATLLIDRLYAH
jgi:hypothetical protein